MGKVGGRAHLLPLRVVDHLGRVRKALRIEHMAVPIDLGQIEDAHQKFHPKVNPSRWAGRYAVLDLQGRPFRWSGGSQV